MKPLFAIVCACGLIVAADNHKEKPMTDQEKIQGIWQLIGGERGGKAFSKEVIENGQIIFAGDKMTTRTKNGSNTAKFKLLGDQSPKGIDVDMSGELGKGIYELTDDTLKIAHTEAGEARPTEFATKPGTPLTLLILKRVKQ